MPAPTAVRTQAANLLNMLWDAIDDGSAFDRAWGHDSVVVEIAGRQIVLSVDVRGTRVQPYIMILVKRL